MNKKILILDTSATMQALFKNKLKKTEFDLQFEKNGIQLIVSMYNTVPDAVIINAKTMNPKSNELVRLIKNVEKIKYIPVAVYATNDFIFEKYFMADCGADVFFHFDEKTLQEEIERALSHHVAKKLHVLDIGTGPGFFAIILCELGYDVTAIDFTPAMLEEARKM